jgi:predicted nucleotidyltransferase
MSNGEAVNADSDLRCKVAKEAATLLYFGAEKEYKQAKLKAANTLGTHFLPTNLEVALELDKIAEAHEGSARKERLIQMRREALKIMRTLKRYRPILIGSVWRGTIRRGSDIDITLYHDVPDEIVNVFKKAGTRISRNEWSSVTKKGKNDESFHIYVETSSKQTAEIVVRSPDEAVCRRRCEVFGDELKGLGLQELEHVLEENPSRKFIPA